MGLLSKNGRLKLFRLSDWNDLSDENRHKWNVVKLEVVRVFDHFEVLLVCELVQEQKKGDGEE